MTSTKHTWTARGYMGREVVRTGYLVAKYFGVAKMPGTSRWIVDHLASGCRVDLAECQTLTEARGNAEKLATISDFDWSNEMPFPLDYAASGKSVKDAVREAVGK